MMTAPMMNKPDLPPLVPARLLLERAAWRRANPIAAAEQAAVRLELLEARADRLGGCARPLTAEQQAAAEQRARRLVRIRARLDAAKAARDAADYLKQAKAVNKARAARYAAADRKNRRTARRRRLDGT